MAMKIEIGKVYALVKCKHSWNNGKLVRVTAVEGDDITAVAVEKQPAGEATRFLVTARNLVASLIP